MKGELTLRVLEMLENIVYINTGFLAAALKSTLCDRRPMHNFNPRLHEPIVRKIAEQRRTSHRLANLISRLEKDGLILREKKDDQWLTSITSRGKAILTKLKNRSSSLLPNKKYEMKAGRTLTIISYDIPEIKRRKRNWLRIVLKRNKFLMLHKSVWIKKVKLPREFVDDLRAIGIIEHLEIMSVSKSGTFSRVI